MKKILLTLVVAIATQLCLLPPTAKGVTPDELEQARTYAAIVYLRNANPGSDYLDKVSATTRKQLASGLKEKEKKNLELFNSSLPSVSGSESWGMDELVSFAQKAVKAPGNYSSKGFAANQVSRKVRAMKLTAPAPKTPKPEEAATAAAPEETPQPSAPEKPAADSVALAQALPEPFDEAAPVADQDSALRAEQDFLMNADTAADTQQAPASSSSTFYIIILCVLVALVVALVIYAARYFNRQGETSRHPDSSPSAPAAAEREEEERQEKSRITQRRPRQSDNDADMQERTIESLRAENAELRRTIDEYKYHLNYLKAEKEKADAEQLQARARTAPAATAQPDTTAQRPTTLNDRFAQRHETPHPTATPSSPTRSAEAKNARVIYLGRANREGMFIRAERDLNPQHSIFRLTTVDNATGSYVVAEDAEVEERILNNPEMTLAISCQTINDDTYGKESVVTEKPGTAVFENGRWRVLKPALVKFV